MRAVRTLILLAGIVVFTACNNYFHDLIPGEGDRIISFSIPDQLFSEINDSNIIVTVAPETLYNSVIPVVRVSKDATLFPITYEYISRSFDDERVFGAAMQIYADGSMTENVIEMIRENKNFTRPVMDLPINFNHPVDFLVVSGQGSVRKYTVKVVIDTGEGRFTSFRFDKFFNPELVRTAEGTINEEEKTVTVNVSYPVENIASYELIPMFETNNARVYLDGNEIKSEISLFNFVKPPDSADLLNPEYGTQEISLVLKRTGYDDSVWTLIVNFSEDPDTSRSIIDFRFTKNKNPLISADCTAEYISVFGNSGFIDVTVYYEGEKPTELRADFISPGIVRVNGEIQSSGISYQDFSNWLSYEVTSRDGNYKRTYMVYVSFVKTTDPLPVMSSFTLSTERNASLAANSTAVIDHKAGIIKIEAAYSGDVIPYNLIPQFSASGSTVTVNGVRQFSGITENNFSAMVLYTVTNPVNPTLKREYRVEVVFVKTLSNVAQIYSFDFYKADNPGLVNDVTAVINQTTGVITATLLFETPGGDRTLVPRWSAHGIVDIDGMVKDGTDERQFYEPVNYNVVSLDGLQKKNYTVTVREVCRRIYVKENAAGKKNGTSWENAYTNLPQACADASLFPDEISREIWIAKGNYSPTDNNSSWDVLYITPNTSYIGGFAGNETSILGRSNPNANKATVSGDLGGGEYSRQLFKTNYSVNGDVCFEYINFTKVRSNSNSYIHGGAIEIEFSSNTFQFIIKNCSFNDLQAYYGGAIYIRRGMIMTISDSMFDNCRADQTAGAIYYASWENNSSISNTDFINCTARGDSKIIYLYDSESTSVYNNCNFTHNDQVYKYDPPINENLAPLYILRIIGNIQFIDCNFTNLTTTNRASENYILGSYGGYSRDGVRYVSSPQNLTMQRCNVILKAGEPMGLIATYTGLYSDGSNCHNYLYMDAVKITHSGSVLQPVLWLDIQSISYFHRFIFRSNNEINSTTILFNQVTLVLALRAIGFLRTQNDTLPAMIP